jgi:hypothetical protein
MYRMVVPSETRWGKEWMGKVMTEKGKSNSYQQATSYTTKQQASHTQPHNVSAFLQGFISYN